MLFRFCSGAYKWCMCFWMQNMLIKYNCLKYIFPCMQLVIFLFFTGFFFSWHLLLFGRIGKTWTLELDRSSQTIEALLKIMKINLILSNSFSLFQGHPVHTFTVLHSHLGVLIVQLHICWGMLLEHFACSRAGYIRICLLPFTQWCNKDEANAAGQLSHPLSNWYLNQNTSSCSSLLTRLHYCDINHRY